MSYLNHLIPKTESKHSFNSQNVSEYMKSYKHCVNKTTQSKFNKNLPFFRPTKFSEKIPKLVIININENGFELKDTYDYVSSIYEEIKLSLTSQSLIAMQEYEDNYLNMIRNSEHDFRNQILYYIEYVEWIVKEYDHDPLRLFLCIEYFTKAIISNIDNFSKYQLNFKEEEIKKVCYYLNYYSSECADEQTILEYFLNFNSKDNFILRFNFLYEYTSLYYESNHSFIEANKIYIISLSKNLKNIKLAYEKYKDFEERMNKRLKRELTKIRQLSKLRELNKYLNNKNKNLNQTNSNEKKESKKSKGTLLSDFNERKEVQYDFEFVNDLAEINIGFILLSNIINVNSFTNTSSIYVDSNFQDNKISKITTLVIIYSWVKEFLQEIDSKYNEEEKEYVNQLTQKQLKKPFSYISTYRHKIIMEIQEKELLNITSKCQDNVSKLSITPKNSNVPSYNNTPKYSPIRINKEEDYIIIGGEKYIKKVSNETYNNTDKNILTINHIENNIDAISNIINNCNNKDAAEELEVILNLDANKDKQIKSNKDLLTKFTINDNALKKDVDLSYFVYVKNSNDKKFLEKINDIDKKEVLLNNNYLNESLEFSNNKVKNENYVNPFNNVVIHPSIDQLLSQIDSISPIKLNYSEEKNKNINPFVQIVNKDSPQICNLFNNLENKQILTNNFDLSNMKNPFSQKEFGSKSQMKDNLSKKQESFEVKNLFK